MGGQWHRPTKEGGEFQLVFQPAISANFYCWGAIQVQTVYSKQLK